MIGPPGDEDEADTEVVDAATLDTIIDEPCVEDEAPEPAPTMEAEATARDLGDGVVASARYVRRIMEAHARELARRRALP